MTTIPRKKTGFSRVTAAFFYSLSGLQAAFLKEAAFRQELILFLILLPVIIFLPVTSVFKCVLLLANTIVLIAELFNSAIEAVVDMVSTDFHPLAKTAKDIGSAAVLVSILLSLSLWVTAIASSLF